MLILQVSAADAGVFKNLVLLVRLTTLRAESDPQGRILSYFLVKRLHCARCVEAAPSTPKEYSPSPFHAFR
jgi:hypothetical protein